VVSISHGARFAFCSRSSTLLPKALDFAMNYLRGFLNRVALMMHSSCLTECLKRILIPHDDFTAEVVFRVLGRRSAIEEALLIKNLKGWLP